MVPMSFLRASASAARLSLETEESYWGCGEAAMHSGAAEGCEDGCAKGSGVWR